MRTCTVHFTGSAPYSASRAHCEPKLDKETADAYEERTWRSKAHIEEGAVAIPPMAFKIGLDRAAKMLSKSRLSASDDLARATLAMICRLYHSAERKEMRAASAKGPPIIFTQPKGIRLTADPIFERGRIDVRRCTQVSREELRLIGIVAVGHSRLL